MNEEKAIEIKNLRRKGMSFRKLAEYSGESISVVRTQCKDITPDEEQDDLFQQIQKKQACAFCGRKIDPVKRGRPRRFCSDECRRAYWRANRDQLKQHPESLYTKVCPYCGKTFTVYGNKNRKYCCHEHYVLDYFGKK